MKKEMIAILIAVSVVVSCKQDNNEISYYLPDKIRNQLEKSISNMEVNIIKRLYILIDVVSMIPEYDSIDTPVILRIKLSDRLGDGNNLSYLKLIENTNRYIYIKGYKIPIISNLDEIYGVIDGEKVEETIKLGSGLVFQVTRDSIWSQVEM